MTITDFARMKGVSRNTVYRDLKNGRVRKSSNGGIDPNDPLNKMYLALPAGGGSASQRSKSRSSDDIDHDEDENTRNRIARELEKLEEDIRWKQRQSQRLDLQIAKDKGTIAPVPFVREWVGYFASGIRLHFLGLGKRIARGDRELQDRIDRAVSIALQKTLDGAARQTKELAEAVAAAMEDPEEEPELDLDDGEGGTDVT